MAKKGADESYLIRCDGAGPQESGPGQVVHEIRTGRGKNLVHLETNAIADKMCDNLSPVMKDLLEVATFVYVAGQLTTRGGAKELDYGTKWHREFEMWVPVRELDFWTSEETKEKLEEILSFVAGEQYRFHFAQKGNENPEFFESNEGFFEEQEISRVVLFSGGLDSFTGAVEEVVGNKRKVALVSHRSDSKMTALQREVYGYIKGNCPGPTPLHVPVMICKGTGYATKDTNQRSRSFLFAALGAAVAATIRLNEAMFYENGVVSCNLPFDSQAPQARRTRSTHPRFLRGMSELVSMVTDTEFVFRNPYFEKTRVEVVKRLVELQHHAAIQKTRSCAKSRYSGKQRHDGVCSQCIDRRFATIAAGCLAHDIQDGYKLNIFTDELNHTRDRTMAVGYVYLADVVQKQAVEEFYRHFGGDLLEIANYMDASREVGVKQVYELYQRHARGVNKVLEDKISEHRSEILAKNWPATCLMELIARGEHKKYPQSAKAQAEGGGKHGKGGLNKQVEAILEGSPRLSSPKIAGRIGNTSPDAVRQTKAWKSRKGEN